EIEPCLVGIDLAGAAPARDRLGRKGGIAVGHDRLRSACGSGGSGGGTASPREAAGAGNSALGERTPGAVSGFVVARSTSHWSWRGKISGAARVSIPDFHPPVGPILANRSTRAILIIDFRRDHPRLERRNKCRRYHVRKPPRPGAGSARNCSRELSAWRRTAGAMEQIGEAAETSEPTIAGARRRSRRLTCVFALLAATLVGGAIAQADEPRFFRIGTAGTTGTYFQIGGILASAISSPPGSPNCQRGGNCGVPGLIAVAQATQGSVENVNLIGRNQLESALSQADIASWAYHGTGIYKGKPAITNLRAIAALFPESVHIVVLQDSPIKTLRDLKGKRVGLGEKESGTLADARIVLEAAGLSEREVKADYSRLSEAAAGLRDKTLDAFFLFGGYPIPA